jgi:HD-like signal output (HDOD) protein
MKLANSTLYGGQAPAATLDEALMRVGTRDLMAHLTVAFANRLFRPTTASPVDVWGASLACAVFARAATRARPDWELVPEAVYTQALLHHVGHLVMLAIAQEIPTAQRMDDPAEEERTLGYSHQLAGRVLAHHWRFPLELTRVIAGHHLLIEDREDFPDAINLTIALIRIGDILAPRILDPEATPVGLEADLRDRWDLPPCPEALDDLGLLPQEIVALLPTILDDLELQLRMLGGPGREPQSAK